MRIIALLLSFSVIVVTLFSLNTQDLTSEDNGKRIATCVGLLGLFFSASNYYLGSKSRTKERKIDSALNLSDRYESAHIRESRKILRDFKASYKKVSNKEFLIYI
ncbi:MAG: hypothetical protein LBV09_05705 [Deferribacteraceae bacterium]|jgi:hypothetical protein|nr:hypothetical protein [Deferribacteraceae bacterium]